MKPVLFRNPKTEKESFYTQEDKVDRFYDALHYHPELQLTAYIASAGTYFVGDRIDRFEAGDVVLIGPNLPHVSRNDAEYYQPNSGLYAHAFSIYFKPESFGREFIELPELFAIKKLLGLSSRGIRVVGATRATIHPMIIALKHLEGMERLLALLEILHRIAVSNEYEFLSSMGYITPQRDIDSKKINDVFDYVMRHFSQKISLEEIAEVANMSPTAFCRFFKQRTRKTFSQFLNEVRIGGACKLLLSERYTVSEIAYQCGYNNISNFNRQFKAITNYTPQGYAKEHRITQHQSA